MFEDSLVKSTGRIRTRSGRLAAGSFLLQAALLGVIAVIPYLYPAALPRHALTTLLTAPPPPPAMARVPPPAAAGHAEAAAQMASLTIPSRIPAHAAANADDHPAVADPGPGFNIGLDASPGVPADMPSMSAGPAQRVVQGPSHSGPARVSAGVAAGGLLAPIHPIYPAIAKAARIQGTVVVEAVISKTGTVVNARAVAGPPMLVRAALDAIAAARYRPYQLNGEPVEVETTIHVIFSLN